MHKDDRRRGAPARMNKKGVVPMEQEKQERARPCNAKRVFGDI